MSSKLFPCCAWGSAVARTKTAAETAALHMRTTITDGLYPVLEEAREDGIEYRGLFKVRQVACLGNAHEFRARDSRVHLLRCRRRRDDILLANDNECRHVDRSELRRRIRTAHQRADAAGDRFRRVGSDQAADVVREVGLRGFRRLAEQLR